MITSDEEYERTHEYVERLQKILLALREAHTPSEYESMSKAYLVELAKAQREITMYLAIPQPVARAKDAA